MSVFLDLYFLLFVRKNEEEHLGTSSWSFDFVSFFEEKRYKILESETHVFLQFFNNKMVERA